jgi:hypothetical protein
MVDDEEKIYEDIFDIDGNNLAKLMYSVLMKILQAKVG